jgi:transcriptional regulator with XRE-family HTH domain
MTLKKTLEALRGVDLAKAVGVHPVTVSAWKRGASFPPATRLPALATALGIPLSDLAALVARERSARLRRLRSAGGVVAGHVVRSSCQQPATKPARSPGHKAAAVAGAAGKVKS